MLKNITRIPPIISRNFYTCYCLRNDDNKVAEEFKKINESVNKREIPNQDDLREFEKLPKFENPIHRTARILKDDLIEVKKKVQKFVGLDIDNKKREIFPNYTDILIIGGGAMGSSIAYWLKHRLPNSLDVVVAERDISYCEASTTLSVGGLRQQFCLPESIEMSLFGAEFLRNFKKNLSVEGHDCPDPQFQPYGYLFLASEKGAQTLSENSKLQIELGAKNILLTARQLKERFPWLNTEGIALGCLGLENEGWFDPWSLLNGFKSKAINLGAQYVQGEVVGFEFDNWGDLRRNTGASGGDHYEKLDKAILKLPNGTFEKIKFAHVIIAAGPFSGHVAKMAKLGIANDERHTPLPIEPRKRYVYCFHCPDGPGLNTPLTIEPGGLYFRREGLGGNYITGCSPSEEEEPSCENLDVDYNYFDEKIWPVLANRIPVFEKLKLKSAWAGFYEYNTLDANGIIGGHPYYHNLYFATGFSGHGIQHSPAVGRGIMELILDGRYTSLDLSRLGFNRLETNKLLIEQNIW